MPGHAEAVLSVNFSPDGRQLASGSGDTTVRFWDLGTQLPAHTCQAHKNWVQCVSWSPDAVMVVSGDQNGVLWLWQPKTGETIGACRECHPYIGNLNSDTPGDTQNAFLFAEMFLG
ncbi:TPA: Notchless protein 1 [Trebouxia sp. C0006]